MHMICKKDLSDAEMDTSTSSPTIVITVNGEVQTREDATVYANLDYESPQKHASSIVARKALR